MCPQAPGSFTSNMPATVMPRNTSSDTKRSLLTTTRIPNQADLRDRGAVPSAAVAVDWIFLHGHGFAVRFAADIGGGEADRRVLRILPLQPVIRDEERRVVPNRRELRLHDRLLGTGRGIHVRGTLVLEREESGVRRRGVRARNVQEPLRGGVLVYDVVADPVEQDCTVGCQTTGVARVPCHRSLFRARGGEHR